MRNADKPKLLEKSPFRSGDGGGKVIRNLRQGPDHYQKLISYSDW